MSVTEMRRLLGLGKTDSYWLVHQGNFETNLVNGKMRVVIDSFEAWYAMQTKHRKDTGEEPGTRLHEETLSAGEIAELLGLSKQQANVLIRKEKEMTLNDSHMPAPGIARRLGMGRNTVYSILSSRQGKAMLETVRLGDRLYVEKDSFTRWLASQSRYKEQRHVSPPRIQLRKPKNPAYYTVEEVCRFYGMRHAELYEKLQNGDLPAIRTRRTWRINRKEYDELLTGRNDD